MSSGENAVAKTLASASLALPGINFSLAQERDVSFCARLFREGFEAGLKSLFGKVPSLDFIEGLMRCFLTTERNGFVVCRQGEQTTGYVLVTASFRRLIRGLLCRGETYRTLCRAALGRYESIWLWSLVKATGYVLRFIVRNKEHRSAGDAQILSIAVDKEMRGYGLGRDLMQRALKYLAQMGAQEVRLEVQPENQTARKLYQNFGFMEKGVLSSPMGPALIMTRLIRPDESVSGEEFYPQ